jgi:hypothetical protein
VSSGRLAVSAILWQVIATVVAQLSLKNPDTLLWLGGPVVLSLGVLIAGLLVRKHSRQGGAALLVLGIGGLILAAAWIAFSFFVDATLGDT